MNRKEFEEFKCLFMILLEKIEFEYESCCVILKRKPKQIRLSAVVCNKMNEVLRTKDNIDNEDYYRISHFFTYHVLDRINEIGRYLPQNKERTTSLFGKINKKVLNRLELYNAYYEELCYELFEMEADFIIDLIDSFDDRRINSKRV